MRQAHRFGGEGQAYEGLTRLTSNGPVWTGKIRLAEDKLVEPLRWKTPRRIFVNSMSDLFHENLTDEQIHPIFAVMSLTPQHTYQILTKRPERMYRYLSSSLTPLGVGDWRVKLDLKNERNVTHYPFNHIWLGVSVENQKTADERIPWLLQTPAVVRFISYEPALGPIYFDDPPPSSDRPSWFYRYEDVRGDPATNQISWVIIGGESGPGARPFNVQWARETIRECRAARVSCFVKQLGSHPFEQRPYEGEQGSTTALKHLGGPPHRTERWFRKDGWTLTHTPTGGSFYVKAYKLKDKKGGDWNEWPHDLKVRQYPREIPQ